MTDQVNDLHSPQFSSLIEELCPLLDQFSSTLDTESECIKKNLPEQLLETANIKNQLANQLTIVTTKIESILTPSGLSLNTLQNSPEFNALKKVTQNHIAEIMVKLEICHDKNLSNGMSIKMISNINKHVLDLISGKKHDVKLYGSKGQKTISSGSQSSLGKA
ncbi:hypothetical protein JCM30760_08150 [Thiomicrorhabdus hydrogeniphila]